MTPKLYSGTEHSGDQDERFSSAEAPEWKCRQETDTFITNGQGQCLWVMWAGEGHFYIKHLKSFTSCNNIFNPHPRAFFHCFFLERGQGKEGEVEKERETSM